MMAGKQIFIELVLFHLIVSRRQYYWHEHPGDCILYISKSLHREKKTSNLYFAYIKIFKDILISSNTLFFNVKSFLITGSWLEYELKQLFWCISCLLVTEWSEILTWFNLQEYHGTERCRHSYCDTGLSLLQPDIVFQPFALRKTTCLHF